MPTGDLLREGVTKFVGNIFIVLMVIGAVPALLRKEMVRVFEFAALAILIATFVYAPELWIGLGKAIAAALKPGQ